jgi:putative transposase
VSAAGGERSELPPLEEEVRTENGFIESINSRLRDECLNTNQFLSIDDARSKIEAWRKDYNLHRPHSALGQLTPDEYLKRRLTEEKKPRISNFEWT